MNGPVRACWLTLGMGALAATCGCSGIDEQRAPAGGPEPCSAASHARLETAGNVLAELELLADELSFDLLDACRAIAVDLNGPSIAGPFVERVEEIVAACSAAKVAVSAATGAGTTITAKPPICSTPATDPACVAGCSRYGPDSECDALCAASAAFRVECSDAEVMVADSEPAARASLEDQLVAIFGAAARSDAAIGGTSELSNVISRTLAAERACAATGIEPTSVAEHASALHTVLVISKQLVDVAALH